MNRVLMLVIVALGVVGCGSTEKVMVTEEVEVLPTVCENALLHASEIVEEIKLGQDMAEAFDSDRVTLVDEVNVEDFELLREECLSGSMASDG